MGRQLDLRIDVTDAVKLGEPAHVTATVVLPEPDALPERPVLCFAKPSSAYSRGYFTCDLPGPAKGAQAAWHAERGWIFAAIDSLGCTGSSQHDEDALDFAALSAAAHAAEQEIALRLANGMLLPGYPPVHQPLVIGIGQSMGGALVIHQQAWCSSYDGIAVLGFSAIHSHPATAPGEDPIVVAWYPRDAPLHDSSRPINAAAMAAAMELGPQDGAWSSLAWGFHYDDVPLELVEHDLVHYEAIAREAGAPPGQEPVPWHSFTTPHRAARSTLTPGVVATEAAAITVPVLSAMGVRDLVVDPLGEPRAFRSARSVDLFICPRMGHMHNFASTRALMWERIHSFGQWCATLKRGA